MLSLFIKEKLYLGEAPIAAVFGIIVGPAALNLFDPSDWGNNHSRTPGGHITNEITLEIMRVTIALSVFAVGVELPKKYLLRHWRSIAMLLGPVMLWGWLVTAAFIRALVSGLDFLNCLVIAACVTPTDPILAQAVVGGPWAEKHVPTHLRHMLQCESGCNDGAAFPFLYLALFLTVHRDNTRTAIAQWFYDALAYQIIFGTILGALIGWTARKAMRFSERKRLVDRESFVASYVSLAIASMGVNVLLGSDDLLAAFACGTAFAWDGWFTRQTEDSNFSNIVDLLFNCATFIYIGALMPWYDMAHAADSLNVWRCFVLAICVLLTKRIPIILALWRWIPDIKTFREAIFSGHFGPIGVGAIFIATLGRSELPDKVNDPPIHTNDVLALTIQPIVFFFVLCSITVHGLTIPFFAFSKRATTITRTWSRNPSFSDAEPGWMGRIRRYQTGETLRSEKEVEGGGMGEIRRVLNAQLGLIGKGAIGGDTGKEFRGEGSSNGEALDGGDELSGSKTRVGLMNARTERDLELAEGDLSLDDYDDDEDQDGSQSGQYGYGRRKKDDIDDLEDWQPNEAEDPSCEWGGEDTAEARIYKAKRAAKREERQRQKHREREQEQSGRKANGDLGEAPKDREDLWGKVKQEDEDDDICRAGEDSFGCSDPRDACEKRSLDREWQHEHEYPSARSWLEGNQLVVEYLSSRNAEPEVHVVELNDDEAESLARSVNGTPDGNASVLHAWLASHKFDLDEHVADRSHHRCGPTDVARELVRSGALQRWIKHYNPRGRASHSAATRGKAKGEAEETEQQRNERADILFSAMKWRQECTNDSENLASARDGEIGPSNVAASGSSDAAKPQTMSPPVPLSQHPHFAGDSRRSSMRRKILRGRVRLGADKTREANEDCSNDDEEEDEESEDDSDADSRFSRSASAGGLSTASIGSQRQSSRRPSGLLKTPSEPERERTGPHNRASSASVSFLNTEDTNHDRVARGNTLHNPGPSYPPPASSFVGGGLNSAELSSTSPAMYRTRSLEPPSASFSDTKDSRDGNQKSFRSHKSRSSKRLSEFLNSLYSSSSSSALPVLSRNSSFDPGSPPKIQTVTLPQDTTSYVPAAYASLGPKARTYLPEDPRTDTHSSSLTPREGILDPPGSAGDSAPRIVISDDVDKRESSNANGSSTVAFRLPSGN